MKAVIRLPLPSRHTGWTLDCAPLLPIIATPTYKYFEESNQILLFLLIMSDMYVNVRNSQLVRSYSVVPSGSHRKVSHASSTLSSNSSNDAGGHYKSPSFAYRSNKQQQNSIIKTRSNTATSVTTTISAGGPRLPPLPRLSTSSRNSNDSNPNASQSSASRFGPPPESLMRGLESSTSNSIFHGIVLIIIMTTSLAAFIGALMYDFCEVPINCTPSVHILFTVTSILSCTFCFLVYFLHLVGQCDYITWSAKRKVTFEILLTMIMLIFVLSCVFTAMHHSIWKNAPSEAKNKVITVISILCLTISAICYVIRIISLTLEVRMLRSKPQDSIQDDMSTPPTGSSLTDRKFSIKSCTSSSTNFATIAHPPPYSLSSYNPKASFTRHKHDIIREIPNNSHAMDTFPRSQGNMTLFEDDEVFIDV